VLFYKIEMKKLSTPARLSIILVVLCLATLWVYPMWRIDMRAPQYPGGLIMKIWINDIKGDVDIVNGLNHYIGMHNIHKADFPEFKYLPLSMIIFMGLALIVFVLNKKISYYIMTAVFAILGLFSFYDFYKWEYHYGHELDPTAPIKVPGMSFQPPLIGYKKLLNFEILSQPDIAGWFYISAGVIMVLGTIYELKFASKNTLKVPDLKAPKIHKPRAHAL
jgi:copper chaperone NosL